MREGFIGVTIEKGATGIPERRIRALAPYAQPLARAVLSLPGGEKVPDEAIHDEADEILERVEELRIKGRTQSRASFMTILRKRGSQIAAPVALISSIGIGARVAAQTKTGKLLTDTATLADVTRWETRPSLEGMPSYEEMRRELEGAIGPDALEDEIPVNPTDYVTSMREQRKQRERHAERVQVRLEAGTGLPDARMREIIQVMTPPSWTGVHAIESVSVSSDKIPLPKEYGIEGYADGICEHGSSHAASGIRLDPGYLWKPVRLSLLNHEFAHANDWRRSNTLSPQDRLTLLYLVHARVSSENRIRFGYVESIKNDNPKRQHLVRITEYWAELMKLALENPAADEEEWERAVTHEAWRLDAKPIERGGKKLNPGADDVRLIRWYLSVTDPDFRPWGAARRRAELVDRTIREAVDARVHAALDVLPPGQPRTMLVNVLERRKADDPKMLRDITRIGYAQSETATGGHPFHVMTASSQSYGNALLFDYAFALDAASERVPEGMRGAASAYQELLEIVDSWRTRRDAGEEFDDMDPRLDRSVIETTKGAAALARALTELGDIQQAEADRHIADYTRVWEGDFVPRVPRPASFERELAALTIPPQT